MPTLSKLTSSLAAIVTIFTLAACSDDTTTPTSSGTSSSGASSSGASSSSGSSGASSSSGSSGSSSGGAGSCSGEITACGMGTLNTTQQGDMCSLILASIDAPAGTKFECKDDGPNSGLFITVNTKEQCVAAKAPAGCKVTVGQLVECYKSAKKDACGAFADAGACAPLFASDSGCTP